MASDKKFFLGVGGQQTGPFSEEEVNAKIASGEVRPDTLTWYEGLGEWQRVDTIAFFQSAFKKNKSEGGGPKSAGRPTGGIDPLRPVFSSEEAVFHRRRGPSNQLVAGIVAIMVIGGISFWMMGGEEDVSLVPRANVQKNTTSRIARLQKAESDSLLSPNTIPSDFLQLIKENGQDEIAKKAAASLETIYKKKLRHGELAQLYMLIGRPQDAVAPFEEQKNFAEAEKAAFAGFEKATDQEQKKKLLLKSIQLLTGQANNIPLAATRIQVFEKLFPNESHPFGYYLLSNEKKMADLFDRTSLFFVENLITHMKAEFPQLKLKGRPVVSIVKEGSDKYRIIATYKGDVILSYDNLSNIKFEYWLVGSEWNLVATNVTVERQSWAKTNKARHSNATLKAPEMLAYMENLMRNQFPRLGLHEKLDKDQVEQATRNTASK